MCVCVCVCVYMFICTEVIEETGRTQGGFLACGDIFGLARTISSLGIFHTFNGVIA